MTTRILRLSPIIGLLLLTLILFNQLAFTDLILARGDTYQYFYPYWDMRHEAFRSGQLPLWNPDLFMGIPLLANPQIGTYYPLNWLVIPFNAPDAVRISIVIHIAIAAIGTLIFFRTTIHKSPIAAMVAGMVFAFGGYVGAHIEQINQLQGLAWLPWLLLGLHLTITKTHSGRYGLLLAMVWALQILSGHTQTVFISGVAMGLYVLFDFSHSQHIQQKAYHLVMLGCVAIGAVILALPQVLPTLELTGMSNRGSGLTANQATAFSMPPTYLARALLPSYDGLLFTEYIAYVGVIALGLGILAVCHLHRDKQSLIWVVFVVLGILFAVGRYTPIYLTIAELPGFDLFRVPARWLALYAFGMAMLAGRGIVLLQEQQITTRLKLLVIGMLLVLMALGRILPILQVDIVGQAQPTLLTMGSWIVALCIVGIIFFVERIQIVTILALMTVGVELLLASQIMPFNDLVPRDVYLGQRFTISQMLALTDEIAPPRMIAISTRLFDLGDGASIDSRYQQLGLDANARQIGFTALKSQEIVAPNLNMTWGIPTIDGYGGGVLPTIYYSQYTSLLLPENSLRTTDGRLGEMMTSPDCRGACIPDLAILRLINTDYLITDKNFDIPYNGIFFDTSLDEYWQQIPQRPDFIFDEVHILSSALIPDTDSEAFEFLGSTYYRAIVDWDMFETLLTDYSDTMLGGSVVNSATSTFQQLTPNGFERILSSDIKIYQLTPSSRVQFATNIVSTPDNWEGHETALDILQDDPATLVVHHATRLEGATGIANITFYSDTRIEIDVQSSNETYLYIADAYYPGWRATVNNQPETVHRANVMFRAVRIPQGQSTVILEFAPQLWIQAGLLGIGIWSAAIVLLSALFLRTRE